MIIIDEHKYYFLVFFPFQFIFLTKFFFSINTFIASHKSVRSFQGRRFEVFLNENAKQFSMNETVTDGLNKNMKKVTRNNNMNI